jgi:hypothetical protein
MTCVCLPRASNLHEILTPRTLYALLVSMIFNFCFSFLIASYYIYLPTGSSTATDLFAESLSGLSPISSPGSSIASNITNFKLPPLESISESDKFSVLYNAVEVLLEAARYQQQNDISNLVSMAVGYLYSYHIVSSFYY